MKKTFVCALTALFLFSIQNMVGQTYRNLWKQVDVAAEKDLPQTQRDLLHHIAQKAEAEKAFGHLLKAELMDASVALAVSPDSLSPAIERLKQREQSATTIPLQAVYQAVLSKIYDEQSRKLEDAKNLAETYRKKSLQHPKELAAVKVSDFEPFITKGEDSHFYGDDLLSVIGYETKQFAALHQYYLTTKNRVAQLFTALKIQEESKRPASAVVQSIDSLIILYGDLQECGEAAILRHVKSLQQQQAPSAQQKIAFIDKALQRWGGWKRMGVLRNQRNSLTNPQFYAAADQRVSIPQQQQSVRLYQLRGIKELTMNVYRVKAEGDLSLTPNNPEDFKKLKALLTALPEYTQKRIFTGKQEYELFEDSLMLSGLPVGVYLLEFKSTPDTEVSRVFYFVSDLRLLAEALPNNQMRYVVVNATSGQPVSGATIRLSDRNQRGNTVQLTTNKKGEVLYKYDNTRRGRTRVYTATDKACPEMNIYGRFYYEENTRQLTQVSVFTDRAIYRPGQQVQAAAIIYQAKNGFEHEVVAEKKIKACLRDANYQVVEEKDLVTDAFGTASAVFTLPSSSLTGSYSVAFDGTSRYFRVEAYKRPTFQVEIPKVTQNYQQGDTLQVSASARSYAGVPVQGAKVHYTVERRVAFWWYRYGQRNTLQNEVVFSGDTETREDGTFEVTLPLIVPESPEPQFYRFVVVADVTDAAGETHQGQLSLPLGNRKTAITVDLPAKIRADEQPPLKVHLLNAAGNDIAAEARYQIDGGKQNTIQTNTAVELPKLKSGKHQLTAVCGEDTVKREFVVFSLDDKRPAIETDDWFYVSAEQFADDTTPVTVQVGSSAKDVHLIYNMVAGDQLLESGAVSRSNELLNRKFTYREAYGNGLTLSFAWVKNGQVYTHTITIRRPVPNKKLHLSWETFRDRLTPGQQEEWTLKIEAPEDDQTSHPSPIVSQFMATLYDKSLDQIIAHQWSLEPSVWLPTASLNWNYLSKRPLRAMGYQHQEFLKVKQLSYNHFDESCFPQNYHIYSHFGPLRNRVTSRSNTMLKEVPVFAKSVNMSDSQSLSTDESEALQGRIAGLQMEETADALESDAKRLQGTGAAEIEIDVPVRQNLQETAFFYPQLLADSTGRVSLTFTLPESLTTWRFMGIAHTQDMMYGFLDAEAVAQKDVMIQPNMPRFLRVGDQGTLSARVINTTDQPLEGTAQLQLIDPESLQVVLSQKVPFTLAANGTQSVAFQVDAAQLQDYSLLVCKMVAAGEGFSDGEQHYLPILSNRERVTVTIPFTQTEPGTKSIDLSTYLGSVAPSSPHSSVSPSLTIEYTNNPAWLMIQALPTLGHPYDHCAVCQAVSFYANSLGQYLLQQNPQAKHVFEMWKQEKGTDTSMQSALAKDESLKDLLLNETPWVLDAEREEQQKARLADFFDENQLKNRLATSLEQLRKLQRADGSWSWWEGMNGSYYMTVQVSEMLVRLNKMTGPQEETRQMLSQAFKYMDTEIQQLVSEMKKEEKIGHKQAFPTYKALQYLYISTLDGRKPSAKVAEAQNYLKRLLKKESRNLSIYDKAQASIILNSKEFLKSLHEWTTYKEGMGRYYDSPRAGYSWRDYRIPTQVAAIEAFQQLAPNDQKTIQEMQQWLLQEKRTQVWDTPINSINAVYAFLNGRSQLLEAQSNTVLKLDGKPVDMPKTTAGIGYVKTTQTFTEGQTPQTLTAEKTSTGTSWGAVYAQYFKETKEISDQGSELSIKREIIADGFKVGNRVKIRLTIRAERDLDFVEVIDRRAACMEPVNQLSGYRSGAYCAPKDNVTHYFFDVFTKGTHIIETEYYLDRAGIYETGTTTVQCAYAPEFRATIHSQTIHVDEKDE